MPVLPNSQHAIGWPPNAIAVRWLGVAERSLIAAAGALIGIVAVVDRDTCLIVTGALGAVAIGAIIVSSWRRAFRGLMIYLPFAGVVTLALYPSPTPLVFKDVLFVAPAYAGFLWSLARGRESLRGVPHSSAILVLLLAAIVVVQSANPGVSKPLVALIGLKVWLLYIPLFFLSLAFVRCERDLISLLRLLTLLSLFPSAIGIAEFLVVQANGYQETMEAIYGASAAAATQQFSRFDLGDSLLVRIPSTFTYVTQYFGFTLAMIVPCYGLLHLESSRGWRRVAALALTVNVLASFLSGSRSAFVFVPLLLLLTLLLDRRVSGAALTGGFAAGLAIAAVSFLGIRLTALYNLLWELVANYAQNTAYSTLMEAITGWPLGAGTGTNTGPARYAYSDAAELATRPAYETYYGKAVHELGVLGLLVVVALFSSLILGGLAHHGKLRSLGLRACSAVLVAFVVSMALNSFKGWQIDLDPINCYFWVFAGVLAKLPLIEAMRPAERSCSYL